MQPSPPVLPLPQTLLFLYILLPVQALNRVLLAGGNGARLKSDTGDVLLDANGGNAYLILGGNAIRGAAPTVAFSAGVLLEENAKVSTKDPNAAVNFARGVERAWSGVKEAGGYLNLTKEAAKFGGPGDAFLEADDEVVFSFVKMLCAATLRFKVSQTANYRIWSCVSKEHRGLSGRLYAISVANTCTRISDALSCDWYRQQTYAYFGCTFVCYNNVLNTAQLPGVAFIIFISSYPTLFMVF